MVRKVGMTRSVDIMLVLGDVILHDEPWVTTADIPPIAGICGLIGADYRGVKIFPRFQFLSDGMPHAAMT